MEPSACRILLIEEDGGLRDEVADALEREGHRVRTEPNGLRLPEVLTRFHPDAVIVGTTFHIGPSGLSIARVARSADDRVILMVSTDGGLDVRLAAFEAGADDFLTVPVDPRELLARLRSVLLRAGRVTSTAWELGDLVVHGPSRTVTRAGTPIELTATQLDLLLALGRRPGQVLSKAQLLDEVWGGESSNGNLVEVHISALRRALDRHGPPMIVTVRGRGYRLIAPDPMAGVVTDAPKAGAGG